MSATTNPNSTLPAAPIAMPTRGLDFRPARRASRSRLAGSVLAARAFTFISTAIATVVATFAMVGAFASSASGALEVTFITLFTLTFGWIAFSLFSTLSGVIFYRPRTWPEQRPVGKVGLVMPVYNEDAAETVGALLAMARGVHELGYGDVFEIAVISDTTKPDAWARETAAITWLRSELEPLGMTAWYRRRSKNSARKSGNVEDFIRRSGARFESIVMLDADSVMTPETLVTLSRRMAGDPNLGLLQTVPALVGARGLLPRMQQFAGDFFGQRIARGVASWSGAQGNFWGHNAIIRTEAFAAACGLPELRGPRPFGGSIQSHDFAEAAWLCRAGWDVRMDPNLGGSFEEGPPTLLDLCVRDRRWMQGNFQHAGLLGARGLPLVSRFHLASGIIGYLASPLWLALLVAGGLLTARAQNVERTYFAEPHQLMPNWPQFDSARMVLLFSATLAVLLAPKAIALVFGVIERLTEQRAHGVSLLRQAAGTLSITLSALAEVFLSALYAPIAMLMQTRAAVEIIGGRDAGWSTQNRADGVTPWAVALRRHWLHTLIGCAVMVLAWFYVPSVALWAAPIIVGLSGSLVLSRISGSVWLGRATCAAGLFVTPEDVARSPILIARDDDAARARNELDGLTPRSVIAHDRRRSAHFALVEKRPRASRGDPDLALLAAQAKLADALSLDEYFEWLSATQVMALLSSADLADEASMLPSRYPRGIQWPTSSHASSTPRSDAFGRLRRALESAVSFGRSSLRPLRVSKLRPMMKRRYASRSPWSGRVHSGPSTS